MCIVGIILTILSTIMGIRLIQSDDEFHIQLSRQERFLCVIADILSCFLLIRLSQNGIDGFVLIFIGLSCSYLLISAITDARCHLIYYFFVHLFFAGAIAGNIWLISTGQEKWIQLFTPIGLFLFAKGLHFLHLYEKGDIALTFVSGMVFCFLSKSFINGLMICCFMLFFAELAMLIHAKKRGILKRGKLTEPMPLGPYLYASFMLFFIIITIL